MPIRKSPPPSAASHVIYNGTTNASGEYVIVYAVAYASSPAIIPTIKAGAANQTIRIVSSTTTGFTVKVEQRNSVNLLATDLLLATTVAVNGAAVQVVVLS